VFLTGEDDVMLADIAATSVEQCEARYKEMLERTKRERGSHKTFQAEFITADCSKVPSIRLTMVWREEPVTYIYRHLPFLMLGT